MTLPDFQDIQNSNRSANFEIVSIEAAGRQNDEIDLEFFNFFEEEARQELGEVERQLHRLDAHPKEALKELRRLFHTLKGSANSVGHYRFGALAHGIKQLCDGVAKTDPAPGILPQLSRSILEASLLLQNLITEVRDPKCSPVEPERVLRIALGVRDFQFKPVRRARIYLT